MDCCSTFCAFLGKCLIPQSCYIDRKRKLFAASTGFWILPVHTVLLSVSSSYLLVLLSGDYTSPNKMPISSTTRASSTRPQDSRGKRKRKEKNEKNANPPRACPKLKSLSLEGMRKKKERDLPASYR